MNDLCAEKLEKHDVSKEFEELAQGYKEMSRINLSLAEEAVASDNEAQMLCEQKFAECE